MIITQFYQQFHTKNAETILVIEKNISFFIVIKSISAVTPRCFPHDKSCSVIQDIPWITSNRKVHFRVHKNLQLVVMRKPVNEINCISWSSSVTLYADVWRKVINYF